MQKFTPATLRRVREELDRALAAVAKRNGIKLTLGTMRYDAEGGGFKVALAGESQAKRAVDRRALEESARWHGLDPDRVGSLGERLVAFTPLQRLRPWRVEHKDGTLHQYPPKMALRLFGVEQTAPPPAVAIGEAVHP